MSRFYTFDGQLIECGIKEARLHRHKVSVTTVLAEIGQKHGLKAYRDRQVAFAAERLCRTCHQSEDEAIWLAKVMEEADRHRNQAADFGSGLHGELEDAIWHNDYDSEWAPWIDPFMQWFDENVETSIWSEKVLVSKLDYAGRADAKVRLWDKRKALFDFKTQDLKGKSPNWYKEWGLQLEAYAKADEEQDGPIDTYFSIVFDSKNPGPPRIKEWDAGTRLDRWIEFHAMLQCWQISNKYYKSEEKVLTPPEVAV